MVVFTIVTIAVLLPYFLIAILPIGITFYFVCARFQCSFRDLKRLHAVCANPRLPLHSLCALLAFSLKSTCTLTVHAVLLPTSSQAPAVALHFGTQTAFLMLHSFHCTWSVLLLSVHCRLLPFSLHSLSCSRCLLLVETESSSGDTQVSKSPCLQMLGEVVDGRSAVRAFRMEAHVTSLFNQACDDHSKTWYAMTCCQWWQYARISAIGAAGVFSAAGMCLHTPMTSVLSIGLVGSVHCAPQRHALSWHHRIGAQLRAASYVLLDRFP